VQKTKKKILVVSAPSQTDEETFADFLSHRHGDQIDLAVAGGFEEGAAFLFPHFDLEMAEKEMGKIKLPQGGYFEIIKDRFGYHIHVYDGEKSKLRYSQMEHMSVGLAVESIERACRRAPFDTLITEETIPLLSVPRSPRTYLGLGLISLAQMAGVKRIGILTPKGSQEVRHYLGDIRCGENRVALCFNHSDWPFVSRELIGV
jgi:hypothetical protein